MNERHTSSRTTGLCKVCATVLLSVVVTINRKRISVAGPFVKANREFGLP